MCSGSALSVGHHSTVVTQDVFRVSTELLDQCYAVIKSIYMGGRDSYAGLLYIWRMPEQDTAIQLNLAPSRQEVKHRNNNITSGYLQNESLCVDTSTQISTKRQTQALLLIPRYYGAGNMTMLT